MLFRSGVIVKVGETKNIPIEEQFADLMSKVSTFIGGSKIKINNLIAAFRQLSVMTNAGISIHDSGDGAARVFQAVVGFVGNRLTRIFFFHAAFHAPALNHEAGDDAVEDGAVVEAVFGVLLEVGGGGGGFVKVEFDVDIAVIGDESDHLRLASLLFSGRISTD